MEMKPRTTCLFHFTKSLDILCKILKEGFWPQYSLEDIAWHNGSARRLAWPMVSFCDMPITRLQDHTEFYGSYGIGLWREEFIPTGVSPVIYISPEADSHLKDALREIRATAGNSSDPRFRHNVALVLAHCKPTKGLVSVSGKEIERDFYSECEWRYLPWVERSDGMNYGFTLQEAEYQDHRIEANSERRHDMLEFKPADVKYLLVKSVQDVHKLAAFINLEMARYGTMVLDLLKTRIIILDEIPQDY